ncbi:MAG TPA: phage baseplate assembly protein V [Pyrinomonadaceae bacterium]|nr:phage baseplate assembly protein V [Pyrinomonadaceae bacterium]
MNLFDVLGESEGRDLLANRIFGVVVGVVTNNQDPDGLARVKVKFPWLSDTEESFWSRVVSPMAGKERGFYFLPEVEDEVLVTFERGDVRFPFVLGALWNGQDRPPEKNDDGKNNARTIKSRSGHVIRMSDEDGKAKIEIIDMSGNNKIVFESAQNTITVTSDKDIVLSASKGTIKLDAQKIEIKSSADAKIEAGAGMDVKATGQLNVKGATVNIN